MDVVPARSAEDCVKERHRRHHHDFRDPVFDGEWIAPART
jgi:hypothetical protein